MHTLSYITLYWESGLKEQPRKSGLGQCFKRAVWQRGLGEQLERGAVKVKNKVKKILQCVKELGSVKMESSLGEQFGRAVQERSLRLLI